MHLGMGGRLGFAAPYQQADQHLHLIGPRFGRHQRRVSGRDDGDVIEADDGHHMTFGDDQVVAGVQRITAPGHGVAVRVLVPQLPHRCPAADVRPAELS